MVPIGCPAGEVNLEVEIDWTGDIDETNEVNNIWSGTIVVNPVQSELGDSSNSDGALSASVPIFGLQSFYSGFLESWSSCMVESNTEDRMTI